MTDNKKNTPGQVQFLESHQPALEAGDYTITVEQTVAVNAQTVLPDPKGKPAKVQQSFSVLGPRFTLDPQEIQSVFPPPGSLGEHSNVLPHIALRRSTLPWERSANGERDIPWLALLLFDEQDFSHLEIGDTEKRELLEKITKPQVKKLIELNQDGAVRLPPLLKKTDPKPDTPYWEMELGDHTDDTVTVIDVPAVLLTAILPSTKELKLLSHVRATMADGEVAVIICNRLPQPGSMSTVHLVSLEGRYKGEDFYDQGGVKMDLIRLVSLYSWRFACLSERHSFKGLLMHLNHQLLFNIPVSDDSDKVLPYLNNVNDKQSPMPDRLSQAFLQSNQPIPGNFLFKDQSTWKITERHRSYFISKSSGKIYNQAGRDINKSIDTSTPNLVQTKADQTLNFSMPSKLVSDNGHWWLGNVNPEFFITNELGYLSVYHLDPDTSSTLRLPRLESRDEGANETAELYFAMGCVPLPHEMRQGNKSVSWYHGPLVPGKIPPMIMIDPPMDLSLASILKKLHEAFSKELFELSGQVSLSVVTQGQSWLLRDDTDEYMVMMDRDNNKLKVFKEVLPIRSADELVRYSRTIGMFDVSYSAAWELGRLLTLQNKRVAVDLFNWKRTHAQSIKDAERQLDHLPFDTHPALDIPESVRTWFENLALLKDLPFNYLVPDERLLPTESIRFFQVDPTWVACLLDGAFSIGRVLSADHTRDSKLNEHLPGEKQMSGFLLRSDVVAGWPGLLVDGYGDSAANEPVTLKRMDRLSKNVLLCLFDGLVQAIDIHLKPETLHFGVSEGDPEQGAAVKWYKTLRSMDSTEPSGQIEVTIKNRNTVDIIDLATKAGSRTSAEFAFQMIEGVEKVRFMQEVR